MSYLGQEREREGGGGGGGGVKEKWRSLQGAMQVEPIARAHNSKEPGNRDAYSKS